MELDISSYLFFLAEMLPKSFLIAMKKFNELTQETKSHKLTAAQILLFVVTFLTGQKLLFQLLYRCELFKFIIYRQLKKFCIKAKSYARWNQRKTHVFLFKVLI